MKGDRKLKVVYLYAEVMGYLMPVFRCLTAKYNCSVTVVKWEKGLTPYKPEIMENVTYFNRSAFNNGKALISFIENIAPDIIYVSGWMDKDYLQACRYFKRRGVKIIAGLDNQWLGTLKQRIATFISPFLIRRNYTHIMAAGVSQFEYAKRLGFKNDEILLGLYSADLDLFSRKVESFAGPLVGRTSRKFLYVGRFAEEKGLILLLDAWRRIGGKSTGWQLCLIGNGPLKETLALRADIEIKDFMQPDLLINEIATSSCFVLPSKFEPWGVVVHEFAASGLPLLVSKKCGAASLFLKQGSNGYSFDPLSERDLADKMLKIINSSGEELDEFSRNSRMLSLAITPDLIAANIFSVLY